MDTIVVNPYSLGSLSQFTFVNYNYNPGATVEIPATGAVGDFAILAQASYNSSGAITKVIPSGWTEIAGTDVEFGAYYRAVCAYKVLESGDPGLSITGMAGSSARKQVHVFRPNRAINTVTLQTVNSEATSGNPVAQSLAITSSSAAVILAFAHFRASDYLNYYNSNYTLGVSGAVYPAGADFAPWLYHDLGHKIFNNNTTKLDCTPDMADMGSTNILQSFYFEFT